MIPGRYKKTECDGLGGQGIYRKLQNGGLYGICPLEFVPALIFP